jgi:hypothetical protein
MAGEYEQLVHAVHADPDEPIMCTGCRAETGNAHTTRIRCPHFPHRGDGAAPRHRGQAPGMREYRSGSWAATLEAQAELERMRQRIRELGGLT